MLYNLKKQFEKDFAIFMSLKYTVMVHKSVPNNAREDIYIYIFIHMQCSIYFWKKKEEEKKRTKTGRNSKVIEGKKHTERGRKKKSITAQNIKN